MATIIHQPDSLSFSMNMSKLRVSTEQIIPVILKMGALEIFNQNYTPGVGNIVEIDLRRIVDKLLLVAIPSTDAVLTEQPLGAADFTITVDGTDINLRIVKGGVNELQSQAHDFIDQNLLSWQPQEKAVLQYAPEWASLYATAERKLKVKAYFLDGTTETILLATCATNKLWSVNVAWYTINEALTKKNPVAWDVWTEDTGGLKLSYTQRYQLRSASAQENLYLWCNTLGGIDSVSLTGFLEDDKKIEHSISQFIDESLSEYDTDKKRELKQNTGYLTTIQSRWMEDFFLSPIRFRVREDGAIKPIVLTQSKVVSSSDDDQFAYEFTYRYSDDPDLLNLARTLDPLPAPEGLTDFFLTELLSALTTALYQDNLYLAVQSPFALGWQKLSFAQLWESALPTLVDNTSILFYDGKLRAKGIGSGITVVNVTVVNETSSFGLNEIISGDNLWLYGLHYQSTDIVYRLYNKIYTAPAKETTLAPADPLLPRIDTYVVDMNYNLRVITGTPAVNPGSYVLGNGELFLKDYLIPAGATQADNMNVSVVYDEQDPQEWIATVSPETFVNVDFANTTAAKHGSKRIRVAVSVPSSETEVPTHTLGERYKGGRIFHLEDGGKSGLIVHEMDTESNVFWANISGYPNYVTGASSTAIGTGKANTDLMLAKPCCQNNAVKYVDQLIVDEFDDYYMPSEMELKALYNARKLVGISNGVYWSSTEVTGTYDWKKARCIDFSNGTTYTRDKNNGFRVRGIRRFNDVEEYTSGVGVGALQLKSTYLSFAAPETFFCEDGVLSMYLSSSIDWTATTTIILEAYLGSLKIGSVGISPSSLDYGFKPGDPSWQIIAVPMKNFHCSRKSLDGFKINLTGSWPNDIDFGIDLIRFQYSTIPLPDDKLQIGKPLSPLPNGILKEFSTPFPYLPGSVSVYVMGVKQKPMVDFVELNGKVLFTETPLEEEILTCDYYRL